MTVTAVVLIKAQTREINQLAQALAELDGVTEVYSVAGRYDLVAIVRAARNEDIADIISQRMHQVPGIADSETLISFRVYRNSDVEAGFSLGLNE
jgi:DNA-binding Lrp family transcriptional regulator